MAKKRRRDSDREAYWRRMVALQECGGRSIRAFCRHEQLSEPSFYTWRRVIREQDAQRSEAAFVPLFVRDDSPDAADAGSVSVAWPGGRVLRLPLTIAAGRVAELVRAIESLPDATCSATANRMRPASRTATAPRP